jgi:hypothetical protein
MLLKPVFIIAIVAVTMIGMMVPSISAETIVDGFSVITTDKFDVVVVFATDGEACSDNQLKQLNIYEQITEKYIKKYLDFDKLNVSALCAEVGEISRSTFPLTLMQLGLSNPDLLIFVGDVTVNEDLVIHDEAYGVWACTSMDEKFNECYSHLIVVCNDCENSLYASPFENGVWTLSHELAHFYFSTNDYSYSEGVHLHQWVYDMCKLTQVNVCEGMDFIQIIDGQSFSLMDINYILNNYDHLERVDESDFDKKLNLSEIRDCSSGYYGDLCKESENVIWDKNKPLVWDDFQGVPGTFSDDHDFSTLSADDTNARIFTNVGYTVWWEKSNNIPCEYKITKLDVVASTSKIESWFHPDRIEGEEDEILKHEQGHFDIAQIHAQEFQAGYEGKDFACPSGIYDDDEIFNEIDGLWLQIKDDWHAMDKTYDIETDHHEDREAQAEWNKKIILLLSTGEYVKETSIPKPTEEQTNEEGGGCLIATATYGSEMAIEVQQLRELRDNQLLQTESGTQFMTMFNDAYYSFSPIIADYERENPYFKEAVKLAITPMISSLSLMENAESESEVLGIGISVIMLNLGMYFGVPAVVVIGIRKRF